MTKTIQTQIPHLEGTVVPYAQVPGVLNTALENNWQIFQLHPTGQGEMLVIFVTGFRSNTMEIEVAEPEPAAEPEPRFNAGS